MAKKQVRPDVERHTVTIAADAQTVDNSDMVPTTITDTDDNLDQIVGEPGNWLPHGDMPPMFEGTIPVGVFKAHPDATLPEYATEGSMCFDLKACISTEEIKGYDKNNTKIQKRTGLFDPIKRLWGVAIEPGERLLIPTGLIFDIPAGFAMLLYPRSGVSLKQGVKLGNCVGVIDSDYVEETFMIAQNDSAVRVIILNGERIAQAEVVATPPKVSFKEQTGRPAQKTSRAGGLGSTGK